MGSPMFRAVHTCSAALACLAAAQAFPVCAQRPPEQAAAAAIRAGDARPVKDLNGRLEGITCFFAPQRPSGSERIGAEPLERLLPPPAPGGRTPPWSEMRRTLEARQDYAARYNRTVLASPAFPYPDVCVAEAAARPGIVSQRAALKPARDDGTLTGAIRSGQINLLRQRLAADPRAALRGDRDFDVAPIAWAFGMGRIDVAEALIAAGADPLQLRPGRGGYATPYVNTLLWGRREAALWLIDRAPSWVALRDGEDVLTATSYALGDDVALHLVERMGARDPAALPAMALPAMRVTTPPRSAAFWRTFLTDRRWAAGCAADADGCVRFARQLAAAGEPDEIRLFFGGSWTPPRAAVSAMIAAAALALDAPRVALLGSFAFDRAALAGAPRLLPPVPRPFFYPADADTPILIGPAISGTYADTPEGHRSAEAAEAERAARRAATIAALMRLGVPSQRLTN